MLCHLFEASPSPQTPSLLSHKREQSSRVGGARRREAASVTEDQNCEAQNLFLDNGIFRGEF
jgi:hypothetical protein